MAPECVISLLDGNAVRAGACLHDGSHKASSTPGAFHLNKEHTGNWNKKLTFFFLPEISQQHPWRCSKLHPNKHGDILHETIRLCHVPSDLQEALWEIKFHCLCLKMYSLVY